MIHHLKIILTTEQRGSINEFLTVFSDGTSTYCKGTAQTWKNEFSAGSAQEATLHIVATEIEDKTKTETTTLLGVTE